MKANEQSSVKSVDVNAKIVAARDLSSSFSASGDCDQIDPIQNFGSGILLRAGDKFVVHPVAEKLRRSEKHIEELDRSLKLYGQRNPALFDVMPDGTPRLCDGVTRKDLRFRQNKPLFCRPITQEELAGRTLEQFILAVNFAGSEGRNETDFQRAIDVVDSEEDLVEFVRQAQERGRGGKKVEAAEKGSVALHLARLANVKESRVQQVLDLKKLARTSEERQLFFDLIWSGKCAVSKLLMVAKLADRQTRGDAIAAIRDGDKEALKRALGTAPPTDALRVTVPSDLRPLFARKAQAEVALKLLTRVTETLLPSAEVDAKHIDALRHDAEELRSSLPYAICGVCNYTGKDASGDECGLCHGRRYLTYREFAADVELQKQKLAKAR